MKFDPKALWDNPPKLSPAVEAALKQIGEGVAKCLEAERKANFMGRFEDTVRAQKPLDPTSQKILDDNFWDLLL